MKTDIEWGVNWDTIEHILDSHIDQCEEGEGKSLCFIETVLVCLLEINQRLEALESDEHRDEDQA